MTDSSLKSLGIQEKDDRKAVLAAIKKADLAIDAGPTDLLPKLGDIQSVGTASISSLGKDKPKVSA